MDAVEAEVTPGIDSASLPNRDGFRQQPTHLLESRGPLEPAPGGRIFRVDQQRPLELPRRLRRVAGLEGRVAGRERGSEFHASQFFQADDIGCHVITVTNDIIGKLGLVGKDMDEYSLETVKVFFNDGKSAGYVL